MFNCIEQKKQISLPEIDPTLPANYVGRSVSIINMRKRIKDENKADLTLINDSQLAPILTKLQDIYGRSCRFDIEDPLSFNNSLIYSHKPKRVGLFPIMDLLYTDFLIVESLSLAKDSVGVKNLRTEKIIINEPSDFPVVEYIDYSLDSAVYHLNSAAYRIRSCFDKLAVLIGYCLHIGKGISRASKYNKKIKKIINAEYTEGLITIEQNEVFKSIIEKVEDIGDLKDLRDHEAHIGNIGVKFGFNGNDAKYEINGLIEIIFSYFDKFRIVFLLMLIFMETLKEGGQFPEKVLVILSSSGLYIFKLPENVKYMSFIVGKNNAIDSIPIKITQEFKNGIVKIETKKNSIVTINFPEDKITKESNGKDYLYNGNIYDRNSSSGFIKNT